jgi:hypothetical protein
MPKRVEGFDREALVRETAIEMLKITTAWRHGTPEKLGGWIGTRSLREAAWYGEGQPRHREAAFVHNTFANSRLIHPQYECSRQ